MSYSSFTSEEDFAAAYDQYADVIFRHCYLRVFSREKAKQLMMNTFTRLWTFIAEGNYVDSMQLILYRLCHQLIEEDYARSTTLKAQEEVDTNSPEFAVLQQLSPQDRSVLILHYVDGFSLQEIGSILGGPLQDHAMSLRKGTSFLSSLLTK